jgi:hypothetical protein
VGERDKKERRRRMNIINELYVHVWNITMKLPPYIILYAKLKNKVL